MNKQAILRVLNPLLFISLSVQAVTGLVMFFDLKVPHLKMFYELHQYNGLLFAVLAVTHLALNWGWVKASYFKK
jgi:hypothetical protein